MTDALGCPNTATMIEARVRLAGGESPPRAAASVGYSSAPAFGAACRAAFGTTPGETRRTRRPV